MASDLKGKLHLQTSESVSSQSCLTLLWLHGLHQAPLSMEFSRQEYWSGFHLLLQRIFPIQWLNLGLLHCRQILYLLSPSGNLKSTVVFILAGTGFLFIIIRNWYSGLRTTLWFWPWRDPGIVISWPENHSFPFSPPSHPLPKSVMYTRYNNRMETKVPLY